MEMIQGMITRLWYSCGLVMVIGVFALLILRKEKGKKAELAFVGWLCIVLGLGMGIWYNYVLLHPQEQTVHAVFLYDEKKMNVMPPLPSSREYIFRTEQGEIYGLYMDSQVKEQLIPQNMEQDKPYQVTYESRTKLILEIQKG